MALIYISFTAFVVQAIFASCGENIKKYLTSLRRYAEVRSISALFSEAGGEMEPSAIACGAM